MLTLSIPSWIRNAAAALCGRHGAVTERAQEAQCSRQTVYDQARRLVEQATQRDQEHDALRAEPAQASGPGRRPGRRGAVGRARGLLSARLGS